MSRKFQFRWEWPVWVVGVVGPHGGMVVWSFYLGPLRVEFWPLAPNDEVVPF